MRFTDFVRDVLGERWETRFGDGPVWVASLPASVAAVRHAVRARSPPGWGGFGRVRVPSAPSRL